MAEIKTVTVNTPTVKSDIFCGEGAFNKYAAELVAGKDIFVVTDSNVYSLYSNLIKDTFGTPPVYIVPAGEKSKNERQLLNILKAMVAAGLRRNSVVIALGGGVIGDMAGLAASLYMRGIQIIQIPTTLLSQVDSSVGGKTAIDFCGVKNIVGTFYQPRYVIADPLFLNTLPAREIRCGLGEIIKTGCLNGDIFDKLTANANNLKDVTFLKEIIYDCICHKAYVVTEDERETTGLRKTLNLGHTAGHAFELYYKKKSHGEFVLIGMYYELYIAVKSGICTQQYADSIIKLIKKVITVPAYADGQKACMLSKYDKKNERAAEVSMVVPREHGITAELKLPLDEYAALINECANSLKG
ncbi:MAG: 3-dehydroquinate synthase [Clostridia bacterium]|nr:3-dehydroquinate synthase [Clostridia bacterium]